MTPQLFHDPPIPKKMIAPLARIVKLPIFLRVPVQYGLSGPKWAEIEQNGPTWSFFACQK